jgi:hypothetical protein
MLASHVLTVGTLQVKAIIFMLAIAGVIFWRLALRIIVFLLVLLLACGAVAFVEGFIHGIG